MQRSKNKNSRTQTVKRVLAFLGTCLIIGIAVTILALFTLGYRQFNGKIEQGGRIQFASIPSGASVVLDSTMSASRTPSQLVTSTGQHFVTMKRDGYRQWQKAITLAAGQVLYLDYARLVPEKLQPVTAQNFAEVSSTIASDDEHWIAVSSAPDAPSFDIVDISGDTTKRAAFVLPTDSYTHPSEGKTQTFRLVDWARDNTHFLIKHTYDDDKTEWLIAARDNQAATHNLTTELGIDASDVQFATNNALTPYVLASGDLRKVDLAAATISRPLVTNVGSFKVSTSVLISYVTAANDVTHTQTVGYYRDGAEDPVVIRTLPETSAPFAIALGRYYGDDYIALAYGTTVEIMKGTLPTSSKDVATLTGVATLQVPNGVTRLEIHDEGSGRFVLARSGTTAVTYDLELKQTSVQTLSGDGAATAQLKWLDHSLLWTDAGGTLQISDFDGANRQKLVPVTPGFAVSLSPNGRYIYNFQRLGNGTVDLKQTRLQL